MIFSFKCFMTRQILLLFIYWFILEFPQTNSWHLGVYASFSCWTWLWICVSQILVMLYKFYIFYYISCTYVKIWGHCLLKMCRKSFGTHSDIILSHFKICFSLTVQIISIISFPLQTMAHFLQTYWKRDLSCWQFPFKCGFLQWFEILCGEIEFPISSSWMPLNM